MNGRTKNLSQTSQTVKNLLWRWIRHAEGIAPKPLTRYEGGMIVVMPTADCQWRAPVVNK